ncbi:MAG: winged helix-turn-helix transcriptional regulator [Thermodesulfovibrionales bacterium]|nr:winged helix-turn-helix transcriptional regulator [Thermodesulfovibrionales bacterium]
MESNLSQNKRLYELQAEVCKTLGNPKRLEIISALRDGEKTVTDLVGILGVPKANVSQHLAVMRNTGVLSNRREGVNIYYSLSSNKVTEACSLMKDVLTERLKDRSDLIERIMV